MRIWRAAAVTAALAVTAAPVAHGQTAAVRVQPRAVDWLVTGGSQIGIQIRDIEQAGDSAPKGVTAGVIVEDVSADSPAEKAGIRKGDVIVEFDGERVRSARQLARLVQETPAGRSVQAVLQRDGQRTTVTVTPSDSRRFSLDHMKELGDLAREFKYRVPPAPPAPPAPAVPFAWSFEGTTRLGATVSTLSPQLAEYFGAKDGVLVSSVAEGSLGARVGLKAGDVITSFNGSSVNSPDDVRRAVQGLDDGEEFTIEIVRERKPTTVKGKFERTEPRRRGGGTLL